MICILMSVCGGVPCRFSYSFRCFAAKANEEIDGWMDEVVMWGFEGWRDGGIDDWLE